MSRGLLLAGDPSSALRRESPDARCRVAWERAPTGPSAAAVLTAANATAEELGTALLRPAVAALARARVHLGGATSVTDVVPLTRRQNEVLTLLAEGLDQPEDRGTAVH